MPRRTEKGISLIHGVTQAFGVTFLSLFPVMNPVGNLPAFVAMTEGDAPAHRHRQALLCAIWVFVLLAIFAVAGKPLLSGLGISLPALQVAGGLIVAHAGFGMVSASTRLTPAEHDHAVEKPDVSFSPMAMPLISGPGALGIVIALSARSCGVQATGGILLGALTMAALVFLLLRYATPLVDRLGPAGIGALTRIFGFLILAIGVELVAHGVLLLAPGLTH